MLQKLLKLIAQKLLHYTEYCQKIPLKLFANANIIYRRNLCIAKSSEKRKWGEGVVLLAILCQRHVIIKYLKIR